MIFWDPSALVAAYLGREPGHVRARSLLTGKTSHHGSVLLRAEAVSAILRRFGPDRRLAQSLLALLLEHLKSFTLLPVGAEVLERAERLIVRHRLRAADAIHVSSAVESFRLLGRQKARFVTSDREQAAAARAEGLSVLQPAP